MTISTWLEFSTQDAKRRGLPALQPLLATLAGSTSVLRNADWNRDASGTSDRSGVAGRPAGENTDSPAQLDGR